MREARRSHVWHRLCHKSTMLLLNTSVLAMLHHSLATRMTYSVYIKVRARLNTNRFLFACRKSIKLGNTSASGIDRYLRKLDSESILTVQRKRWEAEKQFSYDSHQRYAAGPNIEEDGVMQAKPCPEGLIMIAQLNQKRGLVGMFHFRRVNLIFDLHMLNVLLPIRVGATTLPMERAISTWVQMLTTNTYEYYPILG